MIYSLVSKISEHFIAKKCPVVVGYDAQRLRNHGTCVLVEQPKDGTKDRIGPAIGQVRNPKRVASRQIAFRIEVHAQSTKAGAALQDHEALAHRIADMVQVAIENATWGDCQFLSKEDLQLRGIEQWSALVYEMRGYMVHPVSDRDWEGEGKPTATIGGATGMVPSISDVNVYSGTVGPEDPLSDPPVGP